MTLPGTGGYLEWREAPGLAPRAAELTPRPAVVRDRQRLLARGRARGLADPRGVEGDRLSDPLQLVLAARLRLDRRAQLAPGRLGYEDVLVHLAGRRLDPRRDVDRVADDAE